MGLLDNAVPIDELTPNNLWVIYGKSASGKTAFASTFPKPLLYIQVGDDGSNTIKLVKNIDAIRVKNLTELKDILAELEDDEKYKTVLVDTFSLVVNEWIDENGTKKKKRVSQQMWGDLKTDTEEMIRAWKKIAETKIVVLTCHEASDSFIGMEDEIAPDIRPSVSKGARTYLEGMANYGIHTTVIESEKEDSNGQTTIVYKHAIHLATNPYYWVKTQKPKKIKLPKLVINPTYDKVIELMKGEKHNGKINKNEVD